MKQYQISVIVGSLRQDSFNRKLANAIAKLAPTKFSFKQVQIGDLPIYNQDDDANQAPEDRHQGRSRHSVRYGRITVQAKDGLFDEAGNIGTDGKKFLQSWMDQCVAWVKNTRLDAVAGTRFDASRCAAS